MTWLRIRIIDDLVDLEQQSIEGEEHNCQNSFGHRSTKELDEAFIHLLNIVLRHLAIAPSLAIMCVSSGCVIMSIQRTGRGYTTLRVRGRECTAPGCVVTAIVSIGTLRCIPLLPVVMETRLFH